MTSLGNPVIPGKSNKSCLAADREIGPGRGMRTEALGGASAIDSGAPARPPAPPPLRRRPPPSRTPAARRSPVRRNSLARCNGYRRDGGEHSKFKTLFQKTPCAVSANCYFYCVTFHCSIEFPVTFLFGYEFLW